MEDDWKSKKDMSALNESTTSSKIKIKKIETNFGNNNNNYGGNNN